jgi:NADH-quinone oxidoreductase subunit E
VQELLKPFRKERGSLIPVLQEVQARFGYLPREAMLEVSRILHLPETEVYGVATFYNQFRLTPPGKHPIKVCMGTACHMKGGHLILEAWERELRVKVGETTPDREYSLERVACVGCCAMAPVSVVNGGVQGRVTPTRVKGILLTFQMERDQDRERTPAHGS